MLLTPHFSTGPSAQLLVGVRIRLLAHSILRNAPPYLNASTGHLQWVTGASAVRALNMPVSATMNSAQCRAEASRKCSPAQTSTRTPR
jgi:hypothetical protein